MLSCVVNVINVLAMKEDTVSPFADQFNECISKLDEDV